MESLWIVLVAAVSAAVTFFVGRWAAARQTGSAETRAKQLLSDAQREAESIRKEALVEAKDESLRLREAADQEAKQRQSDVQKRESRLNQREESLESATQKLEAKERSLVDREGHVTRLKEKLEADITKLQGELERLAGMTAAEAKASLVEEISNDAKREAMSSVREIEAHAREEGEKRARKIIAVAMQRVASEETSENSQSVINLPNDDMKGRIIGKEGRNIRAFEAATGTNIIVDDTPETVIVSCFDPVRREVAKLTLEKLINDGRIQPARIEETHNKAKAEVERAIKEAGEWAVMEVGITDVHPEMIKVLGRLNYRSSYGQNVLKHLVEASHIAGVIASEIGTDVDLAKRATLMHDIGKAITHEVEGSHAKVGAELARRLKEPAGVVHAIESHHHEVEQQTIEAVIAEVADAISGSRPGARREEVETYVKRLQRLEEIAESFEGVNKCYAMQGGREVRVMVVPDKVDDLQADVLARDIAKSIEEELQYPGQIKVTVIRELRATQYAK